MPRFVQTIEFTTSRIDEVQALIDGFDREHENAPGRASLCADRDRPNTYINVVEFESYEAAMANSDRPETGEFAQRMTELCDGPATFRNLDVLASWPE